jgi:cyclophilin family peptidyl-prolyl cis-trans isomerase
MRYIAAFVLMVVFTSLPLVCAAAPPPAAESKPGPKAEEFCRLHKEMNALLADLAVQQIKFRTANEEQQPEIQRRFKELLVKGEQLEPQFIHAALEAYAEAPNADKPLTDFLVFYTHQCVQRDDYEPAYEAGSLLMDNGCAVKGLANLAGIAAFATNHFAAAEKYFTQAAESGYYKTASQKDKLAAAGSNYMQLLPYYLKAWDKEQAIRADEARTDDLPRVLLKTSKGDIVVELFENEAPNTVANFISLVERGFYNGLTFHRVIEGFMAQGGCPRGDGSGGPGYTIPCECYKSNHRLHFRGSLSMAHRGQDTGGSQFFITFVPTPHLDGKHTVFGRVVEGMDVLAKLQRRNPDDKEAPRGDRIIEARVLRKRQHDYAPKKMPE